MAASITNGIVSNSSLPDMLRRRNNGGISSGAVFAAELLSCSTAMKPVRSLGGPDDALTRRSASNYENDRIARRFGPNPQESKALYASEVAFCAAAGLGPWLIPFD